MQPQRPEGRSVNIAEVLRDAHFGRLQWFAEERDPYDNLYSTTARLFDLLEQRHIGFVLVGGLAMLQYVDGRNTNDIDLIIALSDLEQLPGLTVRSQDRDFARAEFGGVRVDALLISNPLFEQVRQSYTTRQEFNGRQLPCATVEGLLLLKLFALPSLYRQGNFGRSNLYEADIAALMQAYRPDVEALLAELSPHLLKTDIAELRTVLDSIHARIARFEPGNRE